MSEAERTRQEPPTAWMDTRRTGKWNAISIWGESPTISVFEKEAMDSWWTNLKMIQAAANSISELPFFRLPRASEILLTIVCWTLSKRGSTRAQPRNSPNSLLYVEILDGPTVERRKKLALRRLQKLSRQPSCGVAYRKCDSEPRGLQRKPTPRAHQLVPQNDRDWTQ